MNALVEWSDILSVGIEEVDGQHKVLVGLLNELHAAIVHRRGSSECRKTLDRLAEYTRVHFTTEEGLMRVLKYPGIDVHHKQHEELIQEVVALQTKLDAGQAAISFELLHFLKVWLTKHIGESDKRFGQFALSHGIDSSRPATAAPKAKPWWKFW
jgi:hemerythrin